MDRRLRSNKIMESMWTDHSTLVKAWEGRIAGYDLHQSENDDSVHDGDDDCY